jgi:hypothetical protein
MLDFSCQTQSHPFEIQYSLCVLTVIWGLSLGPTECRCGFQRKANRDSGVIAKSIPELKEHDSGLNANGDSGGNANDFRAILGIAIPAKPEYGTGCKTRADQIRLSAGLGRDYWWPSDSSARSSTIDRFRYCCPRWPMLFLKSRLRKEPLSRSL